MISVSVPSRGLSYLNLEKQLQENKNLGFRPLTGTLLSKQNENDLQSNLYRDGFRPLTGTLLSKNPFKVLKTFNVSRFRPLTGTLLSKQVQIKFKKGVDKVSVPSRGLSYLN